MKIMNKILVIVIVALLFAVTIQYKGCISPEIKADTVTLHDTTWQVHDSLIIKKLKVKEVIHDTLPPEYIADTNYPKLKAQYEALVAAYLVKNIYADTVKLDTLGYVSVADTVYKNEIHNRSYRYSYKIPTVTITNTITKTAPPKGNLFMGGGVSGNANGLHLLQGGFLYKSKKDKVFGLNLGINGNNQIVYGVQSYWKIK
jgi:hypothetical protein